MSKLGLIIKREYLERVRSKWFIIGGTDFSACNGGALRFATTADRNFRC
jgi:hypothetical protein